MDTLFRKHDRLLANTSMDIGGYPYPSCRLVGDGLVKMQTDSSLQGGLHRLRQPDQRGDGNEIRTQAQLRGGHPHGRPGARRCGNGPLRLGMGGIQIQGLLHELILLGPYRAIAAT